MLISGGSAGGTAPSFAPTVTVESSATVVPGVGSVDWAARASIKRRGDGVLVMAYYRAVNHYSNEGALHVRFSDDDGATWTAEDTTPAGGAVAGFPMNPEASAGEDAGEPWLYLTATGDLLIHMWRVDYTVSLGGTYQARSTDGGETWSTPEGPIQFDGLTAAENDRTFATDDDFVHDRTIYAGARLYTDASGVPAEMILIASTDHGQTWSRVSTIVGAAEVGGDGAQEVGLEYVGNGTIVAMLRDNNHTQSFRRISRDMGASWGPLDDVTGDVGIAARQRLYTLAHLRGEAGWWADPNLIMVGFVHQTSGSSHPRRACVWLSPDRGSTWSGPHYIDASTEDAGYGDIFWDTTNNRFVVVTYFGTLEAAVLKEYVLQVALTP